MHVSALILGSVLVGVYLYSEPRKAERVSFSDVNACRNRCQQCLLGVTVVLHMRACPV